MKLDVPAHLPQLTLPPGLSPLLASEIYAPAHTARLFPLSSSSQSYSPALLSPLALKCRSSPGILFFFFFFFLFFLPFFGLLPRHMGFPRVGG